MKALLSIPAAAIFTGCFFFVSQVEGQVTSQQTVRKIVVTGSSETEVDPDEIFVSFVFREYYDQKKEKRGIEKIRVEFLKACEDAGIPKANIRVEGMSGSAYNNWFIRKRKKDPDFMAMVTFTILFNSSNGVDALVPKLNDDAVQNMYIQKVSHSKMETFRKEVKINATRAARDKAEYLAASIGERVGKALLIDENEQSVYYPAMMRSAVSNSAMEISAEEPYGGDTDVPYKKIKIRYEIRAEFELL